MVKLNTFSENLNLSLKAAFKAGDKIMSIYNTKNINVQYKKDNSPLTIADKLSNDTINYYLKSSGYPILSEEGININYETRKNWKTFWMIDPIDGTKEFIKKNGEFTVNIALLKNNKPTLGVVYSPYLNQVFFAEEGLGAFKINNINSFENLFQADIIDLSTVLEPKTYTIVVSKSHMNNATQKYVSKQILKFGKVNQIEVGSSLKICKVADGSANCYPRFGPTMEWDTAAAHAVAKISGCKFYVADTPKRELKYNKENLLNPYFIAER